MTGPVSPLPAALLAAALLARAAVAQSCAGSTYSYGGSCVRCPTGASFVASTGVCRPSATLTAGPTDTSFYLSGSQAEGIGAFSSQPSVAYTTGVFNVPNSALLFASGADYLSMTPSTGSALRASLPTGNGPFTLSAWYKCPTSGTMTPLSWGAFAQKATLSAAWTSPSALGSVTTLATGFSAPQGIAVDSFGNAYVADLWNQRIVKISPSGTSSTLAGSGSAAFADNANGALASFNSPTGVAVDTLGNVYVADQYGNRIRKVSPTGSTTTLAGSGSPSSTDNAVGTAATFNNPSGVAVDVSGTVYVADFVGNKIRKVTPSGITTTLAGSGAAGFADNAVGTQAVFNNPYDVAVDLAGVVYVADNLNHRIRKITPTGSTSTLAGSGNAAFADGTGTAASFYNPVGIAVDYLGNVFVADANNHRIRKVSPSGMTTTIAGTGTASLVNGPFSSATFNAPYDVAVDPFGNLVTSDQTNNVVRALALHAASATCDSTWHHLALTHGDDLGFTSKTYLDGALVAVSQQTLVIHFIGSLTINLNSVSGISAGAVQELRVYNRSLSSTDVASLAARCLGNFYSYGGSGTCASCPAGTTFVSPTAGCRPATAPTDTAFYLSGSSAEGVSAFSTTIASPTYAAGPFGAASSSLALASGQYLAAAGSAAPAALPSGGNVAWSASAWVKCAAPATWAGVLEWGAAGDSLGGASPQAAALVVGGAAPPPNSGVVTTLAGGGASGFQDGLGTSALFSGPVGIAADDSGNMFVADIINNRIRKVTPAGVVTVFAGSGAAGCTDAEGTAASFNHPYAVAFGSNGTLYVADYYCQKIRSVSSSGIVSTLAGNGVVGFVDGPAATAQFNAPIRVTVDTKNGIVIVADALNHCIRTITMDGVVATLAGGGSPGFADGWGTNARFQNPYGVAVVPSSSSIVVADSVNNRIRLVTPAGYVSTIAGSGSAAFADGVGAAASFNSPFGLFFDTIRKVVVVTDSYNHRIRVVTLAGAVSTLAGGGSVGGIGSFADGAGTSALFTNPKDVVFVKALGAYAVVDVDNSNRVRLVSPPAIFPSCDSAWHHVALTYSPASAPYSLSSFLDGAYISSTLASISLPSPASSTLRVGWSGTVWSQAYSGSINWIQNAISSDGQKIVASSRSYGNDPGRGQIYISSDGGATFTTASPPTGAVQNWMAVAMSADGSKIFANVEAGGTTAYLSVNGGASFSTASIPSCSLTNWLGASANFSRIVTACASGYIATSLDLGASWTTSLSNSLNFNYVAISGSGQAIVAVVFSLYLVPQINGVGFWLSLDFGLTWAQVALPDQVSNMGIYAAISNDGSTIMAGFRGGCFQSVCSAPHAYRSTNAGITWTDLATSIISGITYPPLSVTTTAVTMLCVSPDGATIYAGVIAADSSSALRTSTDGGATWSTKAYSGGGVPGPIYTFCSVANSGGAIVGTYPGSLFVSTSRPTFNGSLADLRIYNRALLPAEVRSLTLPPTFSSGSGAGTCPAVQGFATLSASDTANPLGYAIVVAPQSTCTMLARSSGTLRCAPATLTTTHLGVPVFFVGRSEDIPLALMSSAPGKCGA